MCTVTKLFNSMGFDVISVSHKNNRPFVEVSAIPKRLAIKSTVPTITQKTETVTITSRVGMWLGCYVSVIQSAQPTINY